MRTYTERMLMTDFNQNLVQFVFALAASTYWMIPLLLCVWVIVWICKRIIKTARS